MIDRGESASDRCGFRCSRTGGLVLLLLLLTCTAGAQSLGDLVTINGFGTWAYGRTDNDSYYLLSGPDGEYDHMAAALTFIGKPFEDVTIYVQPNFEYGHDDFEVELGFAFVDWEINESFHLRAGRVRHPFGIYTEIFDVGTLRPFLNLPQGVYGSKMVARAYNGIGVNGQRFFGRWGLQYDLYGGQIDLKSLASGNITLEDKVKDTIGGRLTLMTPISGLRFGLSAYTGEQEEDVTQDVSGTGGTQTVYGLFAEYLANGWSVRSEWANFDDPTLVVDAIYLEVAYMLTDHWQMAGRWDWYDTNLDLIALGYPAPYQTLVEHEDMALAVNYWVNPKVVFKAEVHRVEGTRFAAPADVDLAIFTGTFESETNAFQLGVNFSF